MYQELQERGVYHLSTAMYRFLKTGSCEIRKQDLDDKQLVFFRPAWLSGKGDGLDFQTVYRQLAGVDSVIRAAGRCNREESEAWIKATYIFQLRKREFMPGGSVSEDTEVTRRTAYR